MMMYEIYETMYITEVITNNNDQVLISLGVGMTPGLVNG